MEALITKNLYFKYNGSKNYILHDVTISVEEGEWIAIMGPNGSGKSTFIKLILGLLQPQRGTIKVFGMEPSKEMHKSRRVIGYMPQRDNVSTKVPVKVKDIVLMGRSAKKGVFKLMTKFDYLAARKALDSVGLENLWDANFSDLSGGQQQRVLFARALAVEPRMLILDEPFNGVDIPSQEKILDVIDTIRHEHGVTVLMVVHDVNPVIHYIDKILLLKRRVIGYGRPEKVLTRERMLEAYNAVIPVIICEDGFCHPLLSDSHGR